MDGTSARTSLEDPYQQSIIVDLLHELEIKKKPLRLAFFDIDGTLITEKKLKITAKQVREAYEEKGFVVNAVTSRPEETLLSHKALVRSHDTLQNLESPHLFMKQGKYLYRDPLSLSSFNGLLNFPISITETGSRILIQQKNLSYLFDDIYERKTFVFHDTWRNETIAALTFLIEKDVLPNIFQNNMPTMDFEGNYENGTEPTRPEMYQLHVDFADPKKSLEENEAEFESFIRLFEKIRHNALLPFQIRSAIEHMKLVNDSNPEGNRFSLYITPLTGSKAEAIEHVIAKLSDVLSIKRSHFEVVIAGDSYTDLDAILYAGIGAKTIGIVVGGARITEDLIHDRVTLITGQSRQSEQLHLLHENNGYYTLSEFGKRRIIIGDKEYPGTIGPETLMAVLNDLDTQN